MFDERDWSALVAKCKSIYQRHGLGIPIPPGVADPVEIFNQTDVAENVFRFVVYILWLNKQSEAFGKAVYTYMFRSDPWEDCTFKVWMLT